MSAMMLAVAFTAGEVFMVANLCRSWAWHHRGLGRRRARAEHARIRHEQPDTAEARLSQDEFVRYFVARRARPAVHVAGALLLAVIASAVACAIGAFGDLP